MSNLEHRYQVSLTKDEVEYIIKFFRFFGDGVLAIEALLQRFERRLRQIRSHEEMLEAYDSFDSIDTGL